MLEFARIAAGGLLNSLVPGLLVVGVALVFTRSLGRHSSPIRFSVWLIALAAIAILPWVGSNGAPSYPMGPAHSTVALTLPQQIATCVFLLWLAGTVFGLAHLGLGLYRLMRLRATCRPIDLDTLDPLLSRAVSDAQSHRRVTLCVSDATRVPAALGYFRPVIVFPAWALAELPPQELSAILLHELAHLRRYDDWTNLAQKFVKAVFFFHPAVWFIESRLTLEREMACDEAVLAANFNPRDYAESLLNLAEKSFLRRGIAMAQAAVGHVRQLKMRLAEILCADRQGSSTRRMTALAVLSIAAMVSAVGISRAPQLVKFSAGDTTTAAAIPSTAQSVAEPRWQAVNLTYTKPSQQALPLGTLQQKHPGASRPGTLKANAVSMRRASLSPQALDQMTLSAEPALLLANFPVELAPARGPMLVVFQGAELSPNGPMLWRVTILRLSPAQQRIVTGTIAKQI
jgi:beta-lactamase regulating signal transducer with metallopeptidase domain